MTGRELIIYILDNNLEDEEMFKDGKPNGFFLTIEEVAVKMHVGIDTVKTMFILGVLDGIKINDIIYIRGDYESKLNGK